MVKYLQKKARELRPCLFIDIGAYVGYYSLLMAREGCDVMAFEPDPRSFVLLTNNLAMNGLKEKAVISNKAVCDKADSRVLFKFSKSPSESSFTSYLNEELVEFVARMSCTTLDAAISTLKPGYKGVIIKIDVEGAALLILRGGMSVIVSSKPYIILEVHRTFDENDELLLLCLLRKYGYRWKILEWRNPKNFIVALEPEARDSLKPS